MKEKIAQALKTEYASFGLSQKALDGVASMLEKTVTDESAIGAAVKEAYVKDFLKSLQSDADTMRQARSKAEKDLEDYKRSHPDTKDEPKNDPDPMQMEINDLKAKFEASETRRLEAEKAARKASILTEVDRIMKANGSTNDFIRETTLKGITVGDDDTAEALATKYKAEYDSNFKKAYGEGAPTPAGKPVVTDYKNGDYKSEIERLRASGRLPQEAE